MPRSNVLQVIEGEWMPWGKKERWICCDCSLTHEVEYRVKDGKMQVRMFRANRSTAAFRREAGIKLTAKKKC